MKSAIKQYIGKYGYRMVLAITLALLSGLGVLDATALSAAPLLFVGDMEMKALEKAVTDALALMKDATTQNQELYQKAADQLKRGDALHAETADKLKANGEVQAKLQKEVFDNAAKFADRMQALEQKSDARVQASEVQKSAGELFTDSAEYKELMKKTSNGNSKHGWDSMVFECTRKAAILNVNPLTNDQPLVRAERLPGVIMPGLRRFTVRDLIPNLRTTSNLIEFASELLFTNAAAPQWDAASAGSTGTEGALKAESALTFQLSNAPVITIAHYIPASRQILSDAVGLQGYINARLTYGLKLEEEDELLNGNNTSGKLNGLRNQQTAFAGGATNQSAIDTLLKSLTQVSLSYFEASGFVLHPVDWQNILLLKDTQNRYLFSDPHSFTAPAIWGKPVVVTQAITQGQFLTGAFDLAAAVWDREDVSIRVAEQHSDWFARNLVAILCEERLALTVFRTAALVGGAISYAG